MLAEDLKKAVLQSAMQGKLVEQKEDEGDAGPLLNKIQEERESLVKNGVIKKTKVLPLITEEEILFDLPANWQWVRLNDVADIFNGNSINAQVKKTHYEGLEVGYPYIATKDVTDDGIVYDNGVKIPYETSFKIACKGTTLVCAEGGSAGRKVGFLNQDVCFGNKLFAIQQFKPILSNKFIYYFSQSSVFKTQFKSMLTGMIGGVSVTNFKKILIPIPPLAEQKRIVEKIEVLMTIIKRYEDLEIQHYSLQQAFPGDLKKSILQAAMQGRLVEQQESEGCALDLIEEIFKQKERLIKEKRLKRPVTLPLITEEEILFDIPVNWQWVRLNDIADIFNGNSINAQVKKTRYEGLEAGYPYIATKDVGDDGIVYDNGVKIPYETSFKIARKGTTLVCAEGGSAGRKVGFLNQDVCFGNKLFAIQQFKPILSNKFIYYFSQSSVFKTQFKSMLTGMIGGVSVTNFKKILIPIPPLAEQKRIVEKLEQLLPLCETLIDTM